MRKQVGVDPDATWWKVKNIDTGKFIDNCFFANDETGEYGVFKTDGFGQVMREFKKGKIKLIDYRA